jgi:hypothetical protein
LVFETTDSSPIELVLVSISASLGPPVLNGFQNHWFAPSRR